MISFGQVSGNVLVDTGSSQEMAYGGLSLPVDGRLAVVTVAHDASAEMRVGGRTIRLEPGSVYRVGGAPDPTSAEPIGRSPTNWSRVRHWSGEIWSKITAGLTPGWKDLGHNAATGRRG